MPQKTIYVREEDNDIFEEAEEMAKRGIIEEDSISSIIASSLLLFIRMKKLEQEKYSEIEVITGFSNNKIHYTRKVKFLGKLISSHQTNIYNDAGQTLMQIYSLYHSSKGKFLLHTEEVNKSTATKKIWYRVYDNFVEIEAPDALLNKIEEDLHKSHTIYLDI